MFLIGAPFVAALEVIIYAGAIMVLFVFVIMMLNLTSQEKENRLLKLKVWIAPSVISLILFAEMVYMLTAKSQNTMGPEIVLPVEVGKLMFGKYMLVTELAGFLLTAGIIGAYHLGQREKRVHHRYLKNENSNECTYGTWNFTCCSSVLYRTGRPAGAPQYNLYANVG